MDRFAEIRVPIAHNNPSITRDETKCVLCGKCKDVCIKQMGVANFWKYDSEDIVCINCGQCANFCPVQAITEHDDVEPFMDAIRDPNKKVAVLVAPAVRVSLGEMFNMPTGAFVANKIVTALKNLGVDYVFDVAFGADLTVMEEATELLLRLENGQDLPMFTSCCPAWVRFVKSFYPQFVPNLSSCKSPIAMQASVIKNIFTKSEGIKPENLTVVALTPCVAKKMEANLLNLRGDYGKDTDIVITSRELGGLLKSRGIDLSKLANTDFDKPFSQGSGAGVMFGASGGVMQAIVRTAYHMKTGETAPSNLLNLKELRGLKGVKTAKVNFGEKTLNLCVVFGTINVRNIVPKLKKHKFDIVEVMACPNGCVGGGGQPRQENNDKAVSVRGANMFACDTMAEQKCSYESSEIQEIYKKHLGKPNSKKAQRLLHVNHMAR